MVTVTMLSVTDKKVLLSHYQVIQVPSGVRPDDVFELVLDLRPFSVICPIDAEGGDNIAVTAPAVSMHLRTSDFTVDDPVPAKAIASANEVTKLAGQLETGDNQVATGGPGRTSLLQIPAIDLTIVENLDTASVSLTSNQKLSASISSTAPNKERAITAAVSSNALVIEAAMNNTSLPSSGIETTNSLKTCDTVLGGSSRNSDNDVTECHNVIVSDRQEELEACATVMNNSSCNPHSLLVDSAHARNASPITMCVSRSEERIEASDTIPFRDGVRCSLCTFNNVTTALTSLDWNKSVSCGAFSCICGDDFKSNILPPVAILIPLATPSMTVLSSIRFPPFI